MRRDCNGPGWVFDPVCGLGEVAVFDFFLWGLINPQRGRALRAVEIGRASDATTPVDVRVTKVGRGR